MAKDKILHLAFDLQKAPAELKTKAAAHNDNLKRLEKAEAQVMLWTEELNEARRIFKESDAELDRSLAAWSPNGAAVKEEKK